MNYSIDHRKQALRKIFLETRRNIAPLTRQNLSQKIAENFKIAVENHNIFLEKKICASYVATKFEANPRYIEHYLTQYNLQICYPKIEHGERILKFIISDQHSALIANPILPSILEPVDGFAVVPDIIIVPLVAFDQKLNRLGMGKGFYDATINYYRNLNPHLKTIGIAFASQLSSQDLPISYTDSPLDLIITDSFIIP